MSRIRRSKRTAKHQRSMVRIGAADRSLTGLAGLVAVDELVGALGVVAELDRAVGPVKQRARGLAAWLELTRLRGHHVVADGLKDVRR